MAVIGEPIRKITVIPIKHPVPETNEPKPAAPEKTPEPEKQPEKEPA